MSIDDTDTAELWDALEQLGPSLRSHIKVYPQAFRGERWYVLLDEVSGNHIRIDSHAYNVLGRFDGSVTLGSIYQVLTDQSAQSESHCPDKEEIIKLISQLHHLGALNGIKEKTTAQLVSDHSKRQSGQRWQKFLNPLAIRIPLFDPDKLLEKMSPYTNFLFTKWAVIAWIAIFLVGLTTTLLELPEIRASFTSEILKPKNLILLWLLYPVIKLVHEFAHAICVKRWGGEVHEMGITLLVLTPVPYVNASASAAFKSRWRRIGVSAAGILVEVFLASVAIILWSVSEPGFFHDTMLGIFLIGAVSTVAFNANPLLKFDGYFILQDFLEIPNLYSRSGEWYSYAFRHYLLRVNDVSSPQTAVGEHRWFVSYGLLSRIYRLVIVFAIALFLSTKLFIVGVALAVWALIQQLLLPVIKMLKYLAATPELEGRRRQAVVPVFITVAAVALLTLVLPLPQNTIAQGVVWTPDQGQIYAPTAGFVVSVHARAGHVVEAGELLITMENPELEQRLAVEQARLALLVKKP